MDKFFLLVLLSLGAFAARAQQSPEAKSKLSILTEEWPPISFEENNKAQGFAVEVVEHIQAITQDKHPIQVVPWARGYREVSNQPNVILFTMIRTKEREKMFTMVGPLGMSEVALYGLADKNLPVHTAEDAKKLYGIAAVDETLFATALQKQGFKNIVFTKNPEQEVRLLAAGRVDLISGEHKVIERALQKAGLAHLKLKRYVLLEKSPFYIAFSNGTDPQVIQQWKKALKQLKTNGSFQKLSQKWLPSNEAPSTVEIVGLRADLNK